MTTTNSPTVLTPDDIATDLQISRESAVDRLRSGEIPGWKLGRYWRADAAAYEAWKSDRAANPVDPNRIAPRSRRSQAAINRSNR